MKWMEIDKMSLFTKTNEQKAINYLVSSVFLFTSCTLSPLFLYKVSVAFIKKQVKTLFCSCFFVPLRHDKEYRF